MNQDLLIENIDKEDENCTKSTAKEMNRKIGYDIDIDCLQFINSYMVQMVQFNICSLLNWMKIKQLVEVVLLMNQLKLLKWQ